jgi:hypothetical protein
MKTTMKSVLPNPSLAARALAATGASLLASGLAAAQANGCQRDVDAAHALVTAHDAGAEAHLASHRARIEAAWAQARVAAATSPSDDACLQLIATQLKAWRKGHLDVAPAPAAPSAATEPAPTAAHGPDPQAPTLQRLDAQTVLLRIPSFNHGYREPLEALVARLRPTDRRWLIDVRGNGGGGDSSYARLLERLRVSELRTPGWRYQATPEAIAAHQRVCPLFAPGDATCVRELQNLVTQLQAAPSGAWVPVPAATPPWRPAPAAAARRLAPRHVLVLSDGQCASSCEQFLLAARQSANVKLMGQPSFGALDYSDLRPFTLPSGRWLFLATSRSERLPAYAIDGVGIPPDILLPAPHTEAERAAELTLAQAWLRAAP